MKRLFCTLILLLMAVTAMAADDDWYMVTRQGCVASLSPAEVVKTTMKVYGFNSRVSQRISSHSPTEVKFIEATNGSGDMLVLVRGVKLCDVVDSDIRKMGAPKPNR